MKLHPASVPVRSLSRSIGLGTLFFFLGVIASPTGPANVIVIAFMVLFGILIAVLYELAYYERFRYQLGENTFDVQSGVISRRDREVPLRRIQNVDVRQNVIQRALGIAAVHVETAGGGQTEVSLRFVDEAEADRLRRVLRSGTREADSIDRERGDPMEDQLFEITPGELLLLSAFTIDPGASVLATIAVSFLSGIDPTGMAPFELLEADVPGGTLTTIAIVLATFVVAAWLLSAVLTFTRYYGFQLSRAGDELYYERGLLQRYSGTIPLEKVQTVTIKESIPFRWFGYGALIVETAGYAPGSAGDRGTESAIPIARNRRVLALARSIEPFEAIELERPPGRARERYAVRYSIVVAALVALAYGFVAITGWFDSWYYTVVFAVVILPAAHLKWRSRGYGDSEEYFFTRTGFWRRTTKVVPYYRIQSVVDTRTIFQRRRRIASVTADTASSATFFGRAATAHDVDEDRATTLRTDLEEQLQEQLLERRRDGRVDPWLEDDSIEDSVDSPAAGQSLDPAEDSTRLGPSPPDASDVENETHWERWPVRSDESEGPPANGKSIRRRSPDTDFDDEREIGYDDRQDDQRDDERELGYDDRQDGQRDDEREKRCGDGHDGQRKGDDEESKSE